jgi:hypothetical protein
LDQKRLSSRDDRPASGGSSRFEHGPRRLVFDAAGVAFGIQV